MSGGFEVEPDELREVEGRYRSQAESLAGRQGMVPGSPDAGPSTPFVSSALQLFGRAVEELGGSVGSLAGALDGTARTYDQTDAAAGGDFESLVSGDTS